MTTLQEYEEELLRQQKINTVLYNQLENIKSQTITKITKEDLNKAEEKYRNAENYLLRCEEENRGHIRDFLDVFRQYLGIKNEKYGISWLRNKTKNKKLVPVLDALQTLYSSLDMDDE